MFQTIYIRFAMMLGFILSSSVFADDHVHVIEWNGEAGQFESVISGDTLADGTQAHEIYELQANKVYLQLTNLNVNSHLTIIGQEPAEGEHPATVQPMSGADGLSGFVGWPSGNFDVMGDNATLHVKNILFNGISFDQTFNLGGAIHARGDKQKVIIEECILSGYVTFTFATFGRSTDIHFLSSIADGFTNGPGGQYFGGVVWGGGSWMGTYDSLEIRNSTIHNVIGEGVVIYETVDWGVIDHNTFANIVMDVVWYRGQNNIRVTNNLMYNTKAHAQSTYDINGWGVWHPGGQGKMSIMPAYSTSHWNSYGEQWVDMENRNIRWENNAWYDSQELTDFMSNTAPWSWEVSTVSIDTSVSPPETTTTVTTQHDTMLALEAQSKWIDDSTTKTIGQMTGVTESGNVHAGDDLGMNLDPMYITTQLARTLDFRDNLTSDTPPFDTQWWTYQADGSYTSYQYPTHLDMSYSATSAAATASSTGGPVGDPRWMGVDTGTLENGNDVIANEFTLKQNYPNPFNPTTDIAFTLEQSSNVNLTIFNVLGQKVKVLANDNKVAGTHTLRWNGLDEMGASVPTGLYFYTLTSGEKSITKKMALMK
jgi:hypothetical protein